MYIVVRDGSGLHGPLSAPLSDLLSVGPDSRSCPRNSRYNVVTGTGRRVEGQGPGYRGGGKGADNHDSADPAQVTLYLPITRLLTPSHSKSQPQVEYKPTGTGVPIGVLNINSRAMQSDIRACTGLAPIVTSKEITIRRSRSGFLLVFGG